VKLFKHLQSTHLHPLCEIRDFDTSRLRNAGAAEPMKLEDASTLVGIVNHEQEGRVRYVGSPEQMTEDD